MVIENKVSFEPPKDIPKAIEVVTNKVFDDEPCFWLSEENRLSKSGKTMCRYQLLKIVRNDRLVTAYIYLGPASKFTADQFNIMGGTIDEKGRGEAVHTVAELRSGADELRALPPRRELAPLPLQNRFRDRVEERVRQDRHQSTFGHQGQIVRA